MDSISICVTFIAALLGIAYPILFEVVSRLDEKYPSQSIFELFEQERENKIFLLLLKFTLLLIPLWLLDIPPLVDLKRFNFLIEDSAKHLLILSTASLIFSFFFFVRKIMIYYTPSRFINYLIQRHLRDEI